MVDIKEIKSIELVPFTLMSSSIGAILGLIYAIILLIFLGGLSATLHTGGLALISLGVSMIIIFPISMFLFYTTVSFISALIYNMLVPRIGGLKLGLNGDEVRSLPVVSFALILATLEAIWALIIGLLLAAIVLPFFASVSTLLPIISGVLANATNVTNATNITPATLPTGSAAGTAGVVTILFLIIGLPILVFIFGFIGHALTAFFYNVIIPRVGGIRLELVPSGAVHSITSIPVVPAALATASVALIWGIIEGIFRLISMTAMGNAAGGVLDLIGYIIAYFVLTFIMVAIGTIVYNYLASRIGGIQLGLE